MLTIEHDWYVSKNIWDIFYHAFQQLELKLGISKAWDSFETYEGPTSDLRLKGSLNKNETHDVLEIELI